MMMLGIAKRIAYASVAVLSGSLLLLAAPAAQTTTDVAVAQPAPLDVGRKIYFPIIGSTTNRHIQFRNVFGLTAEPLEAWAGLNQLINTNTAWTRRFEILWRDIEPTPGVRHWNPLSHYEQEMRLASENGINLINIVGIAPAWAQQQHGVACGPFKQDALAAFGDFMHDLVARYSQPPFNMKFWELGNEPDVNVGDVPGNSLFGCWGDSSDPYFGGGYYAEMLKAAYPRIKQADPNAQVLVGGLLLDCDPENPPAGRNCTPGRFLEGILRAGGAPYFDGVSFHAYDGITTGADGSVRYANSNWRTAWNTTGPVGLAKARFIRGVLLQYGVFDKYLINTESAVICYGCPEPLPDSILAAWEEAKQSYVVEAYAAAIADGWAGNLWYRVLGWFGSEFADWGMNPKPAYHAYKFASEQLWSANFIGTVTANEIGPANARGWQFDLGDRKMWVIAPATEAAQTLQLSATPSAIYDAFGHPRPIATSLTLTRTPVYIEFPLAR